MIYNSARRIAENFEVVLNSKSVVSLSRTISSQQDELYEAVNLVDLIDDQIEIVKGNQTLVLTYNQQYLNIVKYLFKKILLKIKNNPELGKIRPKFIETGQLHNPEGLFQLFSKFDLLIVPFLHNLPEDTQYCNLDTKIDNHLFSILKSRSEGCKQFKENTVLEQLKTQIIFGIIDYNKFQNFFEEIKNCIQLRECDECREIKAPKLFFQHSINSLNYNEIENNYPFGEVKIPPQGLLRFSKFFSKLPKYTLAKGFWIYANIKDSYYCDFFFSKGIIVPIKFMIGKNILKNIQKDYLDYRRIIQLILIRCFFNKLIDVFQLKREYFRSLNGETLSEQEKDFIYGFKIISKTDLLPLSKDGQIIKWIEKNERDFSFYHNNLVIKEEIEIFLLENLFDPEHLLDLTEDGIKCLTVKFKNDLLKYGNEFLIFEKITLSSNIYLDELNDFIEKQVGKPTIELKDMDIIKFSRYFLLQKFVFSNSTILFNKIEKIVENLTWLNTFKEIFSNFNFKEEPNFEMLINKIFKKILTFREIFTRCEDKNNLVYEKYHEFLAWISKESMDYYKTLGRVISYFLHDKESFNFLDVYPPRKIITSNTNFVAVLAGVIGSKDKISHKHILRKNRFCLKIRTKIHDWEQFKISLMIPESIHMLPGESSEVTFFIEEKEFFDFLDAQKLFDLKLYWFEMEDNQELCPKLIAQINNLEICKRNSILPFEKCNKITDIRSIIIKHLIEKTDPLVLIIFDGLGYFLLEENGILNNFQKSQNYRIKKKAIFASLPTSTVSNHFSILTGLIPAIHNIDFSPTDKNNKIQDLPFGKELIHNEIGIPGNLMKFLSFWGTPEKDIGALLLLALNGINSNQIEYQKSKNAEELFAQLIQDINSNNRKKLYICQIGNLDQNVTGSMAINEGFNFFYHKNLAIGFCSEIIKNCFYSFDTFLSKLLEICPKSKVLITSDHGLIQKNSQLNIGGFGKSRFKTVSIEQGSLYKYFFYLIKNEGLNQILYGLPTTGDLSYVASLSDISLSKSKQITHSGASVLETLVPFIEIEGENK